MIGKLTDRAENPVRVPTPVAPGLAQLARAPRNCGRQNAGVHMNAQTDKVQSAVAQLTAG